MKDHDRYLCRIVSLMVVLSFLTGCTHIVKTSDFYALETGSPLRGVSPKTFAFKEFKDSRNVENPSLILRDPLTRIHGYILDQPPAILTAMWIKRELERNGHTCVIFSSQVKADFIVEGIVYMFSYIWGEITDIGVKLTISRVAADQGVFIKSYKGSSFRPSQQPLMHSHLEELFNQANISMIKEISTDADLVEFIKK